MKMEFTNKMIFGFDGPNLSLLGSKDDFKELAKTILDITTPGFEICIEMNSLDFIEVTDDSVKVYFISNAGGDKFGVFKDNKNLVFELDDRYWERIFKYFILMSWNKSTFYLNSFEDCLRDLPLDQECHLICSSEF